MNEKRVYREGLMTLGQFHKILMERYSPVVLIEGMRNLPEADRAILMGFGEWLVETYPHAIFRTGNAKGSDEAFASGVRAVAPARLQCVLPFAGHRRKAMDPDSVSFTLKDASAPAQWLVAEQTVKASPQYGAWMAKRDTLPALRAKVDYVLRDTLKVMGLQDSVLYPASIGIFYVNSDDPMKGGTGHTIRVCRNLGVPVVFQDQWMNWPTRRGGATPEPP